MRLSDSKARNSSPDAEPDGAMRTGEIEEGTNRYLIHPISRALVRHLARWGIHPNAVSLFGMVLGGGAALAYYHYAHWPMALLGFVLMIGWHVMDGADGQLARMTGRTSEIGKVLDGLCDHLTFALVYLSLTIAAAEVRGGWVWMLAVGAGLSHLAQASAYEFQRQSYDFWVHGKSAARITRPQDLRQTRRNKSGLARLFGHLHLLYLRLQYRAAAVDVPLLDRLEAARTAPDGPERLARMYRALNLAGVRRWSLLCSNYRTTAIFLACLAGSPLYFFVFEIVVLNAVFAVLIRRQRRQNEILHRQLVRCEEHLQPGEAA